MAKGKKSKGKKAGGGFPKKIAGIRVPKKVRKVAGGAVSFLDHPVVADIVAAALFTAASKLSENPKGRKGRGQGQDQGSQDRRGSDGQAQAQEEREKTLNQMHR